ncbi:MAG TPA: nitrite/sulfite reductase [Vicinamibacterales bacterium]|jgi:sulfite reductase (NADPH) hemoprotein beta-component
MSSTEQQLNTHGRARLSFASEADIDEFASVLEKYERGEMTPDQWRSFRLVRGTYGQRQSADAQMLRVKVPQGVLTSDQLTALAEVGEKYSRRFGHITTRQNIQFHFVKLHDVEPAMRLLADAGLTTREACGNSVRNITGCPYAGVAADERFDVTPYADATTRYFLRKKISSTLPRKFKIAFEGCPEDHTAIAINDLSFHAELGPDGSRGFRVLAGGGTALMCKSAGVIHEFLPVSETLRVVEAMLRVFQRHGDYQHKQRNRMKFMIKALGWDVWLQEYQKEFAACRADVPALDIDSPAVEPPPSAPRTEPPSPNLIVSRVAAAPPSGPGITPPVVPVFLAGDEAYARWRLTNVRQQKQFGYVLATATAPLGDLTSEQMRVLGELALAYGDGTVRVSPDQNLVFRWVPIGELRELYRRLAAAGLGLAEASTVADVASCPGAESCRLAVTQSRGLGRLLEEHLRSRPDLIAAADGAHIKISGCPNGCGQHHIATIGFQGSVRRLGGRAVPQYFVMVGGGTTEYGASFARTVAKIPARRIPDVVDRLIAMYAKEKSAGESAPAFFQRIEPARVTEVLQDLQQLTPADAVPLDFVDLAETGEFTPEVMDGECSA